MNVATEKENRKKILLNEKKKNVVNSTVLCSGKVYLVIPQTRY